MPDETAKWVEGLIESHNGNRLSLGTKLLLKKPFQRGKRLSTKLKIFLVDWTPCEDGSYSIVKRVECYPDELQTTLGDLRRFKGYRPFILGD